MANSERPPGYQYFNELSNHLEGDLTKIFNGELVYPRQLEIHLPGDGKLPCNFHCAHCQGRMLDRPVGRWEEDGLSLVYQLKGKVPYHIYGGAYTEPLINPYILAYLWATKSTGSTFGIHTNGSMLLKLERYNGFLTELCRIAETPKDYLSISLDAGSPFSHMKNKNLKHNWFDIIIDGITQAVEIRGDKDYPAIRVCYLLNEHNSCDFEIEQITKIMKKIGVDSLRFSIPYDHYGKSFKVVVKYRNSYEVPYNNIYYERIKPYLSKSNNEKPFIFYIPPEYQDVKRMNFQQCIYSYFQITLAADGYIYKCSSTATPSFKFNRLGKITNDLKAFDNMMKINHDPDFIASTCFKAGARCNRMALEINKEWESIND